MLTLDELRAAMHLRPYAELCALLGVVSARIGAAAALTLSAAEQERLAEDLALAALFAVDADLYQRPDMYVFAGSGLAEPHIGAFLDRLFARDPAWRVGILERLHAHHLGRRRAR